MDWIVYFGLVGFFSGILLYYFLLSLLWRKRPRLSTDRALITLLVGLLLWYSGNFVALILRSMDFSRLGPLLPAIEAIAFAGLSVLPLLLFYVHWSYFQRRNEPTVLQRRLAKGVLGLLALPLGGLPFGLARFFPDASTEIPLDKLGPWFAVPFLGMLAVSYYGSALCQWNLLRQTNNEVEQSLFRHLLPYFLAIPVFNFWVYYMWGSPPDTDFRRLMLDLAFLSSIPPTLVVAYFIYHHRFLQVFVERRIVSLLLILVSAVFYLVGIREFVAPFLESRLSADVTLIEGVSLAGLLLLLPSLNRWLEAHTASLFRGELERYQKLAENLNQRLPHATDSKVQRLLIEEAIAKELESFPVKIHGAKHKPTAEQSNIFPLDAGGRLQGYLEVASPALKQSVPMREAMHLLANEIAVALERARLVETKLQLERELSRKSQMEELGRMAANVAHNVKNPLSSIKTLLQLFLEADNLTDDQKAEVSMMVGEVDRLSLTITSLLKFSRLEKTEWEAPRTDSVHLKALFSSVRSIFRGDLEAKSIRLEVDVAPNLPMLATDAAAMTDILSNLVINAVEASGPGDKILLRGRSQAQTFVVEVEDQGPGIPSSIRENLFEPFVTTRTRGTGLGLAIVKKQVDRIGAAVSVVSPLNDRGTRFTLTIPRKYRSSKEPPAPLEELHERTDR